MTTAQDGGKVVSLTYRQENSYRSSEMDNVQNKCKIRGALLNSSANQQKFEKTQITFATY